MRRINIIAVFVFLGLVAQAQIIPMPIKQYVPVKDQLELLDGQ